LNKTLGEPLAPQTWIDLLLLASYTSESEDGGNTFSPRKFLAATNVNGTPVLLDNGEKRYGNLGNK